jgi:hypothetical protein
MNQYKDQGRKSVFSVDTLKCYLTITRYGSDVFDELRALTTLGQAFDVLNLGGSPPAHIKQYDRELLAAWLNFANGGYGWDELVLDTNGDNVPDLSFGAAIGPAEAVRVTPGSTVKQFDAQRKILTAFNK